MSERYEIREKIGKGGMGAVYRAYDTVMKRYVALKRLLPLEDTNLNEISQGTLTREAAALARFQHPNVVTIFALEKDDEGHFVVMELVEGEDLFQLLKEGALSWDDFKDVAPQCLEPLIAAGELNLLHRDIKPGNIMLTLTAAGRFIVKLLDFGLAKFSQQPSLQTLDQRGSFLGSIEFIAPEQLELEPLDQRTDLYSLGCVFYYMLTQVSPFAGGNPAETSSNHLNHRCRPLHGIRRDVPPQVSDWVMRLIARNREDRPADAREALREFNDAVRMISSVSQSREAVGANEEVESPTAPTVTAEPRSTLPNLPKLPTSNVKVPPRENRTGPVSGPIRAIPQSARHRQLSSRISRSLGKGGRKKELPTAEATPPRRLAPQTNWTLFVLIAIGLLVLVFVAILLMR